MTTLPPIEANMSQASTLDASPSSLRNTNSLVLRMHTLALLVKEGEAKTEAASPAPPRVRQLVTKAWGPPGYRPPEESRLRSIPNVIERVLSLDKLSKGKGLSRKIRLRRVVSMTKAQHVEVEEKKTNHDGIPVSKITF